MNWNDERCKAEKDAMEQEKEWKALKAAHERALHGVVNTTAGLQQEQSADAAREADMRTAGKRIGESLRAGTMVDLARDYDVARAALDLYLKRTDEARRELVKDVDRARGAILRYIGESK